MQNWKPMMLDVSYRDDIMLFIGREDKALQRCTLSARSMPGDGQDHRFGPVLLSSHPSSGRKAKNLLNWGEAPTRSKEPKQTISLRHMAASEGGCGVPHRRHARFSFPQRVLLTI